MTATDARWSTATRCHPAVRRLLERARDDRGAATTEILFILPLLFSLVLAIAQVTVWGHATHVAQAAASHALAATRAEGGTAADGQAEAQRVLDQLGRGPLHDPHVQVTRGPNRAEVEVGGTASSVVPFLHLHVHAEAAGPVEKFSPSSTSTP